MVRPYPVHVTELNLPSAAIAVGLFASVIALVALCAKRGAKSPKRYENDPYEVNGNNWPINYSNTPPRFPLATPKRLFTSISNLKGNSNDKNKGELGGDNNMVGNTKDAFGEGGLWQKNILMGEKCQPLEFSGVIYYDNYGNRVAELPRSPRAGPASLHTGFSFPVSPHRSS